MHKTLIAAAIAATVVMGGAAHAADMYAAGSAKDAPIAAPEVSWTGFYIGVGAGGLGVNNDVKASLTPIYNYVNDPSVELDGLGAEGVFGTVQVGYDRQYGNIVGGIFFDYDFADASSDLKLNGQKIASITLNDMWSVGGRLGYLLNSSTLAYFLAAYTQANFDLPAGLKGNDPSGYTLGGGLETKLGGNWFLRAEYRFTQLDKETVFNRPISECWNLKVTDQTDIQSARLVLSYKADIFGHEYTPLK